MFDDSIVVEEAYESRHEKEEDEPLDGVSVGRGIWDKSVREVKSSHAQEKLEHPPPHGAGDPTFDEKGEVNAAS